MDIGLQIWTWITVLLRKSDDGNYMLRKSDDGNYMLRKMGQVKKIRETPR